MTSFCDPVLGRPRFEDSTPALTQAQILQMQLFPTDIPTATTKRKVQSELRLCVIDLKGRVTTIQKSEREIERISKAITATEEELTRLNTRANRLRIQLKELQEATEIIQNKKSNAENEYSLIHDRLNLLMTVVDPEYHIKDIPQLGKSNGSRPSTSRYNNDTLFDKLDKELNQNLSRSDLHTFKPYEVQNVERKTFHPSRDSIIKVPQRSNSNLSSYNSARPGSSLRVRGNSQNPTMGGLERRTDLIRKSLLKTGELSVKNESGKLAYKSAHEIIDLVTNASKQRKVNDSISLNNKNVEKYYEQNLYRSNRQSENSNDKFDTYKPNGSLSEIFNTNTTKPESKRESVVSVLALAEDILERKKTRESKNSFSEIEQLGDIDKAKYKNSEFCSDDNHLWRISVRSLDSEIQPIPGNVKIYNPKSSVFSLLDVSDDTRCVVSQFSNVSLLNNANSRFSFSQQSSHKPRICTSSRINSYLPNAGSSLRPVIGTVIKQYQTPESEQSQQRNISFNKFNTPCSLNLSFNEIAKKSYSDKSLHKKVISSSNISDATNTSVESVRNPRRSVTSSTLNSNTVKNTNRDNKTCDSCISHMLSERYECNEKNTISEPDNDNIKENETDTNINTQSKNRGSILGPLYAYTGLFKNKGRQSLTRKKSNSHDSQSSTQSNKEDIFDAVESNRNFVQIEPDRFGIYGGIVPKKKTSFNDIFHDTSIKLDMGDSSPNIHYTSAIESDVDVEDEVIESNLLKHKSIISKTSELPSTVIYHKSDKDIDVTEYQSDEAKRTNLRYVTDTTENVVSNENHNTDNTKIQEQSEKENMVAKENSEGFNNFNIKKTNIDSKVVTLAENFLSKLFSKYDNINNNIDNKNNVINNNIDNKNNVINNNIDNKNNIINNNIDNINNVINNNIDNENSVINNNIDNKNNIINNNIDDINNVINNNIDNKNNIINNNIDDINNVINNNIDNENSVINNNIDNENSVINNSNFTDSINRSISSNTKTLDKFENSEIIISTNSDSENSNIILNNETNYPSSIQNNQLSSEKKELTILTDQLELEIITNTNSSDKTEIKTCNKMDSCDKTTKNEILIDNPNSDSINETQKKKKYLSSGINIEQTTEKVLPHKIEQTLNNINKSSIVKEKHLGNTDYQSTISNAIYSQPARIITTNISTVSPPTNINLKNDISYPKVSNIISSGTNNILQAPRIINQISTQRHDVSYVSPSILPSSRLHQIYNAPILASPVPLSSVIHNVPEYISVNNKINQPNSIIYSPQYNLSTSPEVIGQHIYYPKVSEDFQQAQMRQNQVHNIQIQQAQRKQMEQQQMELQQAQMQQAQMQQAQMQQAQIQQAQLHQMELQQAQMQQAQMQQAQMQQMHMQQMQMHMQQGNMHSHNQPSSQREWLDFSQIGIELSNIYHGSSGFYL